MTKEQVRQILERVRNWPAERQADLAEVAVLMEAQDKSDISLTEEQVDEVRRRLAEPAPKTMTLAEFSERLRHRYGV
jgi:hypothetical protein